MLDGILAKEGESRQSLGRERYLERMRAFSDSTKPVMLGQQRRVGGSFDWGRLRYTMDDGSAKAVRVAFERLYRDGLAYRTEALVNWCPGCLTSVSDLEVVATPETGTIWSIRYHLIDEATGQPDPGARRSRSPRPGPRRILGDTAVAVHPDDARYRGARRAAGAHPVRRARRADHRRRRWSTRASAPGAVKITPAHDHDDHATGLRHGLPAITILADDATIADTGTRLRRPRPVRGPAPDRGRPRGAGDLVGSRPHEMVIGRCQRSDDVVEPRLKTQWFIRMAGLAAPRARRVTRPAARASCRSTSRRPGSTG